MALSRRDILRGGLGVGAGLIIGGCGESNKTASLPSVPWPDVSAHPSTTAAPRPTVSHTGSTGVLDGALSRSQWTAAHTIRSRVDAMAGVQRITIHHEGASDAPVEFADVDTTRRRLESIRRQHLARGWADIGYHYVIDRAGRVWEARPTHYQGAHVKNQNEHNIGVMVLGNFDIQSPSRGQVATLPQLIAALRTRHGVPERLVKTHQEWNPTACPGKSLQAQVNQFRSRRAWA